MTAILLIFCTKVAAQAIFLAQDLYEHDTEEYHPYGYACQLHSQTAAPARYVSVPVSMGLRLILYGPATIRC